MIRQKMMTSNSFPPTTRTTPTDVGPDGFAAGKDRGKNIIIIIYVCQCKDWEELFRLYLVGNEFEHGHWLFAKLAGNPGTTKRFAWCGKKAKIKHLGIPVLCVPFFSEPAAAV